MTEFGSALIMRILDVGRDITEMAVTDRCERGINALIPEFDFGDKANSITASASGIRASGNPIDRQLEQLRRCGHTRLD